jgi:hypothetical protein
MPTDAGAALPASAFDGGRAVFRGHIAGFGTEIGLRIVVGLWLESPFGRFADVMYESRVGIRTLLAPTDQVADFVRGTYEFDEVHVVPVSARRLPDALAVHAGPLRVDVALGGPAPIDRVLRLVPRRFATNRTWLRALDPIASRVQPGAHTAGAAQAGRREYYGVLRSRAIVDVVGDIDGTDLGSLRPVDPPVRFGFASAPKRPQVLSVVTTVVEA